MTNLVYLVTHKEKKQLESLYSLYVASLYSKAQAKAFEQALFAAYGEEEELTGEALYGAFTQFRILLEVHLGIQV